MDKKEKTLQERGQLAAIAYVERCGMVILEKEYRTSAGVIPIIARDEATLVLVQVRVHTRTVVTEPKPSRAEVRKYHKQAMAYRKAATINWPVRHDVVSLLVLGEDQALLRHHRAFVEAEEV